MDCEYEVLTRLPSGHNVLRCRWCLHRRETPYEPARVRRKCPSREATEEESAGLGDRVSQALALVGVTESRVTAWLGVPCGCAERRAKLNQLGKWASSALAGKFFHAPWEEAQE